MPEAVDIVIYIHTNFLLWAALMVLIFPLDWILAATSAALFHELCHILSVYCLNGKILRINVQSNGCILETNRMKERKQFICILAGPLGSLSLLLLYRVAPKVAVFGFIHGDIVAFSSASEAGVGTDYRIESGKKRKEIQKE